MCASDYDDKFPSNGTGWQDNVMPYSKDRGVLNAFTSTYSGGDRSNPSDTDLGYVDGPGGRAVAYLDGHVRWVPNP